MISERIKQIIDNESLSVREFERRISCGQGVIAKCVKHNTDISSSVMAQIVKTFPQYSPIWILTGEGEMFVSKSVSSEEKCKQSKDMKTEIEEGITQISGLQEKADEFFSRIEQMEKDAKKRDFILERMAATLDGIRQDLSKLHSDENDFSHCG